MDGKRAGNEGQWGYKIVDLPLLPVCMQSTPNLVFFSFACRDLMLAKVSMGLKPEFSANAMGTESSASAKARIAYCSRPGLCREGQKMNGKITLWPRLTLTAASSTASEHATSAAPPPYTTRLSRTKLRTTHRASCNERFASSMIYSN